MDEEKPKKERNFATMKHQMRREFGVRAEEKVPQQSGEIERGPNARWVKGQSGNPKGRPKRVLPNGASWKELYQSRQAQVIEKHIKLLNDKKTPAHVVMAAISEWNNRSMGKVEQKVEIEANVQSTAASYDLSGLSLEALRQLRDAVEKSEVIDAEIVDPDLPQLPDINSDGDGDA